jgi:hypothetical protein
MANFDLLAPESFVIPCQGLFSCPDTKIPDGAVRSKQACGRYRYRTPSGMVPIGFAHKNSHLTGGLPTLL